jgi:hypothetical protein
MADLDEEMLEDFRPMPSPLKNVWTAPRPEKHPKPCHCCDGSGTETDNLKLGRSLSGLRLRKGITLRALARELGISHTYLWQLENGKRNWTPAILRNYRNAL